MSTMVYPIERLTEHVCAKTLELVQELGGGLERITAEHPDTPGIDRLAETVDADPLPLFALALYVQLRALHYAQFPDEAVGLVRERSATTLAAGLMKPELTEALLTWLTTLEQGWDQLSAGEGEAWIEPIVKAIEKHYGLTEEDQGAVWARLFYLTLIAEAYRTHANALANLIKQSPDFSPVPVATP